MNVKCFDTEEAEKALKNCPKIVQEYVQLLKNVNEMSKETIAHAVKALKQQRKW